MGQVENELALGIKAVIDWYYEKANTAKYQNRMHSYINWIEKAKELEKKFNKELGNKFSDTTDSSSNI